MVVPRWAEATGQQSQQVTLAQAAAVLADWRELAWGERLREGVWQDIHALFADKQLPPLLAARFLVEQAASLAISPREQFSLLQVGSADCFTMKFSICIVTCLDFCIPYPCLLMMN